MRKGWVVVVLFACLLVGGCATLRDDCTVNGYPYWTGSTWALINPYDYYYCGEEGKIYHHNHTQLDVVIAFQPAEYVLQAKPNIPAEYYQEPSEYYFVR